jgi:hypothetical protein
VSALPPSGTAEQTLGPNALLDALRTSAGSLVAGAGAGSWDDAPDVTALEPTRAEAVLAAWTGARLHAGVSGLLAATDPDVGLLVGDWCFAHSLRALATGGDLAAIGTLATAIGECAALLGTPDLAAADRLSRLAAIWSGVTGKLAPAH